MMIDLKIKTSKPINTYLTLIFVTIVILASIFAVYQKLDNKADPEKGQVQDQITNIPKNTSKISKKEKGDPLAFKASIKSANVSDILLSEYISNNTISRDRENKSTKNLGWIPYWNQSKAFSTLKKNVGIFDYVGVFWYLMRRDGSLTKYPFAFEDPAIINFAKSNDIKILAVVANLPSEDEGGDWDPSRVTEIISNSESRKQHIADLIALAQKKNFDGINIDYEALPADQKANFTAFIKELSAALHKKGKILGVSLHPKISEGDPEYSNGSEAQDWVQLSKYADQLYIMSYDEHWETSPPGPIASAPWFTSVMIYAKQLIPAKKLFAGVPLDGYNWGGSGKARGVTYSNVKNLISKYKPKVIFDQISKTPHFSYREGGVSHEVWYENVDSFKAKLNVLNNLGLSNLSFWPLGGEDTRIWKNL